MIDIGLMRDLINDRAQNLRDEIDKFQDEMVVKLKVAQDNEILQAVQALGRRLDAIEARLPPAEED